MRLHVLSDLHLEFGPLEIPRTDADAVVDFSPAGRRLRARDTAQLHAASVKWLSGALAKCNPTRTIVVTHHAPSARSEAPYHATSPLRPAFASDLDFLVQQSGVPLW